MNILKLMTYLFSKMKSGLLKKHICLLFACVMGIFLVSSSFISCAPGLGNQGSGSTDGGSGDDDDDDDDDDDETRNTECEADGDDDDLCKDDESCVRVCEHIYADHEEVTECKDRDEKQVGRMDKIHNLLMEDFDSANELENNLNSISEEERDISKDDLVCYLEISGDKWIAEIKNGLKGDAEGKVARLEKVLDWFVKNQDIAEILKDDIDDGDDILKALLVALKELSGSPICLSSESSTDPPNRSTDIDLWSLNGEDIKIRWHDGTKKSEGRIAMESPADAKVYDALSCLHITERNIFSYSAFKEKNEVMFEMAFELLVKVCDDVTTRDEGNENKACARAMMCWTAWRDVNGGGKGANKPKDASNDFWDLAEQHKSNLDSNESRFNDCNAEHFAEFFQ